MNTVLGKQVQHDNSGVGHNWRNIDASDIPANIREEIECEIIDGKKDECDDYVASNGLHYRWNSKIVGGVYNGMTEAEVAASRATFPHEG